MMNPDKKSLAILFCSFLCCVFSLSAQTPSFLEISAACGITDVPDITDLFGNGAAAADFDNDGDIDFYLTTDKNIPDRLYENDGSGNFTDIAPEAGILELKSNRAALWFDYNGDHLPDLVVAGENCVGLICENPVHLALYEQTSDNKFIEVTSEANLRTGIIFDYLPFFGVGGLSAGDLNNDDYLDLILTVWGGGIIYFQNNGDATFSNGTEAANLTLEKKTPWQAMLHDFNKDGWMDIYCNVDFSDNKLWINKGGFFEDEAEKYGVNSAFNEMGLAISDYDNDGDLDLYMTNITRDFQGQSQYNVLLKQEKENGQATFKRRGQGASQSGWDWGTTFIDINNDGRQDLAATNGWANDLEWGVDDRSNLWLNTLAAGFVDVSVQCGFNDILDATTLLGADLDRDGDVDMLQTLKDNDSTQKPVHIYENRLEESSAATNYINIKPRMGGANHFAIGSMVTVVADELVSSRLISAGCSFYGQEPAEAFFGLGEREGIEEVKVKWPNGEISIYQDLAINQINTLEYDFIRAPQNLTATLGNGSEINLRWEDSSPNEDGFILYSSDDSTFAEYETVLIEKDATSYRYDGHEGGSKPYFKLRAYNSKVLSDDSNVAVIDYLMAGPGQKTGTIFFPNPISENNLTIVSDREYAGTVEIRFFDVSGKLIWSDEINKSNLPLEYSHPVNVPGGTYLISVRMGDFKIWEKLVVSND